MVIRRSENSYAAKRRQMPHVVVIERYAGFRDEDRKRIDEQIARITNGQECLVTSRWQGDRDVPVFHFASEHQAAAFKEWASRERVSSWPAPTFGPTQEERAAMEAIVLRWAVRTGALRPVVQAYRRAMHDGESITRCNMASRKEYQRYALPREAEWYDAPRMIVSWAMREHGPWFHGWRPSIWHDPREHPPQDAYPHSE